jgi:hypothetical protein
VTALLASDEARRFIVGDNVVIDGGHVEPDARVA